MERGNLAAADPMLLLRLLRLLPPKVLLILMAARILARMVMAWKVWMRGRGLQTPSRMVTMASPPEGVVPRGQEEEAGEHEALLALDRLAVHQALARVSLLAPPSLEEAGPLAMSLTTCNPVQVKQEVQQQGGRRTMDLLLSRPPRQLWHTWRPFPPSSANHSLVSSWQRTAHSMRACKGMGNSPWIRRVPLL